MKAKLNNVQDKSWIHAFNYYLENHNEKESDRLAYLDLLKEYPELKEFKEFAK